MTTKKTQLWQGDCLEQMKSIPDGSVSLVLTDPPYNIGVAAWDKIDGYTDWCISWLKECQRVLKPNGVLYFWHNDMAQLARLLVEIEKRTALAFVSFCIWDKGDTFRPNSWKNRRPDSATVLRSWFNVCEYCLHFFNAPKDAESSWKHTGLDRINSNPNCYKELKEWYAAEKERLGLTDKDIAEFYTKQTGNLINTVFKAYNTARLVPLEDLDVDVTFGEYANPSFEAVVETLSNPNTPMSIEAKVDEMWGDSKDDAWKETEVKRIKEQQGIVTMDEPALRTEVNNGGSY